jgi:CMP-N-acetylneuraminic acid synthetase
MDNVMLLPSNDEYKIIAFIPARGGSKGVPKKALRRLGDLPLIAYTIRDALSVVGITKVFVSTDDPEIRDVSIHYGAEVPFLRPPELAQDASDLGDAISYSMDWYRNHQEFVPQIFIIMSPTHPFRRPNLINTALNLGLANPRIFNIGSLARARVMIDNYWTKRDGRVDRFQLPINGKLEQSAFYQSAFSFNIVFEFRADLPNRRVPCILNEIESIDIDEPNDLELARMVIQEGLYPFNEQS